MTATGERVAAPNLITFRGRVSSVLRWDPRQGLLRVRLVPESGGGKQDMVCWGDAASPVQEGDILRLRGQRTRGEDGRPGFRWHELERVPPVTREGEVAFLRGMVKGLAKPQAESLLTAGGSLDGAIRIATEDPETLQRLFPKAPRLRARLRAADWSQRFRDLDVFASLQSAGMHANQVADLVRSFGAASLLQLARETPYRFCQLPQVGFRTAERVAQFFADQVGRPLDPMDPERLLFGLRDLVGELTREGDVCIHRHDILRRAPKALGIPQGQATQEALERALREAVDRRVLGEEYGDFYTRAMQRLEQGAATGLLKLIAGGAQALPKSRTAILRLLADSGLSLEQQEGVATLARSPVALLVGGPGRGKTRTLKSFMDLLESHGRSVLMLAPTGKAAKRAADMTGRPAMTIHKAAGLTGDVALHSGKPARKLAPREKFTEDVVIVDEVSMVDLALFVELVRRIRAGRTALILVGDPDQLPSVSPGQVLRDLLDSEQVPTARLTEVWRQAGGSPIVDAADAINRGEMPTFETDGYRLRAFHTPDTGSEGDVVLRWTVQAVRRWIEQLNLHPLQDVQVYAPQRPGRAGLYRLNEALQAALNPDGTAAEGRMTIDGKFVPRIGDKVMQLANNYKLRLAADEAVAEVMNGTVGTIVDLDAKSRTIDVRYDDWTSPVRYRGAAEYGQLGPAYAMSIHRAQGSEARYAFLVADSSMNMRMLNRPLIYTGITRAKEGAIWLGPLTLLERAAQNMDGVIRRSHLAERLRQDQGAKRKESTLRIT
jgi:exodeoxyribonuclease V alpha subunit